MRTRVGYAGGEQPSPTYRSIGDHTETLQVDYDPAQISYDELLAIFWDAHDPTARSWSRQYMAAVFYHNDTQNKLASESKAREALRRKGTVHTGILPFTGFFLAEDYHQKYTLRNRTELMREFQQFGFSATDLVNSTAAARVNGYLGGNGTSEQFEGELELLGLSENGKNLLRKSIENR